MFNIENVRLLLARGKRMAFVAGSHVRLHLAVSAPR